MAHKQQKMEVVPPAEEPEEMPLPSDPKVIFLGGLFGLALLAAVYVAAEIVLPLVLAVVVSLLLQPAMRFLEQWHVPRMLAALLLILAVFGTIVGLGAAIAGPASTWAAKLPEGIPRLQERLSFLQAPINTLQRFFAAGGELWTAARSTRRCFGGRLYAHDEALHWHPEFCQRILYDHSVSAFPARVW
jgi:predicted PurR-regulated permease PerM